MGFSEIRLTSWREFRDHADEMSPEKPNEATFVFRGQSDASWRLRSCLLRIFRTADAVTAIAMEDQLLSQFQSHVLRFVRQEDVPHQSVELDRLAWWALMQHHGAPTRLLDWTMSPYVATYFAVESGLDRDGAIFAVHREPLERTAAASAAPEFVLDRDAYMRSDGAQPTLRTYFPRRQNERFAPQQGVFVYADHILCDHETALAPIYEQVQQAHPTKYVLMKFIVPQELKTEFLMRLRVVNVSGLTLFPGLDGLGRHAAETARLHANPE